jgi:hypothetical protein
MDQILLMLHFFGLGAGFTGAMAGGLLLRQMMAAGPAEVPVIQRLQPIFTRVGEIGLALLWITGPWMVATRYAGFGNLPWQFWVKFVCVVGVTAGVIMIDLTSKRARQGDMAARRQLPAYGAVTGILLGLAVIFAVLAFN